MKLEPLKKQEGMTSSMMSRVMGGQNDVLPTLTVSPAENTNDGDDSDWAKQP